MWLTFAPIPDFVMSFYSISRSDVDWLSVVFFVVSVVVGFVGIFILDTWGLKLAVSLVSLQHTACCTLSIKTSVYGRLNMSVDCAWELDSCILLNQHAAESASSVVESGYVNVTYTWGD